MAREQSKRSLFGNYSQSDTVAWHLPVLVLSSDNESMIDQSKNCVIKIAYTVFFLFPREYFEITPRN